MKCLQRRFATLSLLIAVLVAAPTTELAQIAGGSIVGTIFDSSGAVVVGVKVTVTNLGTNQKDQTVSNEQGYYEFPLLPAARYVLEGEAQGFKRAKSAEFTLYSGTKPRIRGNCGS